VIFSNHISYQTRSHTAQVNRGSRSVFAEGKPVARRGDSADLGAMIGASRNVFAG
jgi:uncharacterized Zn-binding protein involved in type VI secretion